MPILAQRRFPFGCKKRKRKKQKSWIRAKHRSRIQVSCRVSRLSAFDVTVSTNRVIHRAKWKRGNYYVRSGLFEWPQST